MSTTYTQLLGFLVSTAGGFENLAVVPDDQIWVIRDVEWYVPFATIGGAQGAASLRTTDANVPFAVVGAADSFGGQSHHWDGRQVANPGVVIQVNTDIPGWSVRVSGFVFST